MITLSHIVLNWVILDQQGKQRPDLAVTAGALLPDAAMFVFYGIEKFRGIAEETIWKEHYYLPAWQAVFDSANSLPIVLLLFSVAYWQKWRWLGLLAASMALHVAFDLPLHHDDGHRHFWPLSDWRFESPVSYWDPAHYGDIWIWIELSLCAIALAFLWRRYDSRVGRAILLLMAGSYVVFGFFAATMWA